jgi:protease-4
MKQFFKMMLASMLGIIMAIVILFFIMIGFLTAIISSADKPKEVIVSSSSILHVKLDYEIKDRTSERAFGNFDFSSLEAKRTLGLNDILKNIKKAKGDDKIKGIYLEASTIQAGIATIDEIRNALLDFKKSGKFIISYADFYTQKAYYLVSVADKIYLNPAGRMEFKGLNYEITFIKGTLDKLGIEPQIIRHGKFKSAIEPLVNEKMSEENREQAKTFISAIWNEMTVKVADARKLSLDHLNKIADEMPVPNGLTAMEAGLIDSIKYYDEVLAELKSRIGVSNEKDMNWITLNKYSNAADPLKREFTKDRLAVIFASGSIVDGEDDKEDNISSVDMAKAIREARLDDDVKAVVFRVNSGGGSALASEVIWREMALTKAVKPVVVSMGDYAASGGYYISCMADTILANPMTLTGSIGVFGVVPNMQELFTDKMGLTFDGITTNALSDINEINRPMSDAEKEIVLGQIEDIYNTFTQRVADGRNKSQSNVDTLGQGRVWSGKDALGNGLVDAFGGLDTAISIAAKMAALDKYKIVELPRQKDALEKILGDLYGDVNVFFLKNELGEMNYHYYEKVKEAIQMSGIQARLPFILEIK